MVTGIKNTIIIDTVWFNKLKTDFFTKCLKKNKRKLAAKYKIKFKIVKNVENKSAERVDKHVHRAKVEETLSF